MHVSREFRFGSLGFCVVMEKRLEFLPRMTRIFTDFLYFACKSVAGFLFRPHKVLKNLRFLSPPQILHHGGTGGQWSMSIGRGIFAVLRRAGGRHSIFDMV